MFHVDAQLGLRQVPDVAHAGRDLVILAQIFANGLRLCLSDSTITSFAMVLFSYIINSQPDGGSKTQRNAKGSPIRGAGERQRD